MQKQPRLCQFQAALILLLSAMIGIEPMRSASTHPYQEKSAESYEQEQAHWRERIQRDPKNPEAYLQLGASLASESSEGYWCTTPAETVYHQAIAAVAPNAEIHFRLGRHLVSDPDVNCDEHSPTAIEERKKDGLIHLRQAIAIASEDASVEKTIQAAELLIQVDKPESSR
jgi:hypothetical protein